MTSTIFVIKLVGDIPIFTVLLVEDILALKPSDIINHLHSEVGAKASYMKA
ncbi:3954_t:CDS:2 [Cetraspora pellucida]|uniref:3954_t:CDS:1 n=1 Tax=Cetraspora pellucida TaxID=1433469 RepID=A0ACA9KB01_9GLOM|nr:3954_t:CDS:2 [Cetraspora pellucida]